MGIPGDDPIYRNSDADMPSFVGVSTFLQSPLIQTPEGLKDEGVEVAIMGAPFDMGVVNRPGARFGPRAIRQAGYFGAPNDDLYHMGLQVYPTDVLSVADFGDANCPPSSLERSHEAIQTKVSQCLKAGALPIVVGGDHSITLPSATAVANHYGPGKVGIVHFDAHADLRNSYNNNKFSHASAIRRCLDDRNVSVISFGIRNISLTEIPFLKKNKKRIKIYWAKDKSSWNLNKFKKIISNKKVYLTFDVDGLDSSLMPATGTPEPGGLFWDETIKIIKIAAQSSHIIGADINELSPIKGFDSYNFLTAKLAYKIISYSFEFKKPRY
mgnify:CR=1 FL=1